jgi:uncharacterized protein YndB with AHSA1/START domain
MRHHHLDTAAASEGDPVGQPVEVSIDIDAPPEKVYDLVADLPRMGQWSPENTGGRWLDGVTTAAPGARFRGTNKRGPLRWYTICTITQAERGRILEWENGVAGFNVARWRYELRPNGSGTTVVESTEDRRGRALKIASPVVMGIADRDAHNRAGMEHTLRALKVAAEAK